MRLAKPLRNHGPTEKACEGRLFTPMVSTSGQGLGADREDEPDRTARGGPLGTASVGERTKTDDAALAARPRA